MAVCYILDKYNTRMYQVFCSKIQPHIHSYVTYVHVEILELNYMLSIDVELMDMYIPCIRIQRMYIHNKIHPVVQD